MDTATGLTERQGDAARLIGRGYSERHTARVIGVVRATIQNWKKLPAFADEAERARANRLEPTPRGTLIEAAYHARKDDNVDWSNRVRAALALLDLEDRNPGADDDAEPVWVT